ncbi:hypothetical protein AAHC03_022815 [Spirometra sp. Aus1]
MPHITVFRAARVKRYYAPFISFATFFRLTFFVSSLFIPFLIAYRSSGFWLTRIISFEQPFFKSTREIYFEAHGVDQTYSWSTIPGLNPQLTSSLTIPALSFVEFDDNNDGILDRCNLVFSLPVTDTFSMVYLVVVISQTKDNSVSRLPLMVELRSSGGIGTKDVWLTSPISVLTQPALKQKPATEMLEFGSTYISDFYPEFMRKYLAKEPTVLKIQPELAVWTPGYSSPDDPFIANITLLYKSVRVERPASFWQQILYGWIQYLPLLIFCLYVSDQIQHFAFSNNFFDNCLVKSG